jgi:FkbM family methyltransferase
MLSFVDSMNRIYMHVRILRFMVRFFRNWPALYLRRLLRLPNTVLIMRNGLVFHTPNILETIPIISEIFQKKVYGSLDDLPKNPTILDIGAYVGTFSLYAARLRPDARIYAFEPERSNFLALEQNVRANGITNVVPINKAVGAKTEARTLFVRGAGYGTNSLFQKLNSASASVTVECVSLADFFTENGIERCDLLKLDCEGSEPEIYATLPPQVKRVLVEWPRKAARPTVTVPTVFVPKGGLFYS